MRTGLPSRRVNRKPARSSLKVFTSSSHNRNGHIFPQPDSGRGVTAIVDAREVAAHGDVEGQLLHFAFDGQCGSFLGLQGAAVSGWHNTVWNNHLLREERFQHGGTSPGNGGVAGRWVAQSWRFLPSLRCRVLKVAVAHMQTETCLFANRRRTGSLTLSNTWSRRALLPCLRAAKILRPYSNRNHAIHSMSALPGGGCKMSTWLDSIITTAATICITSLPALIAGCEYLILSATSVPTLN